MFKKIWFYFLLMILFFFLFNFGFAQAQNNDKLEYVLFYSHTCPHCQAELKFIDKILKPKYKDLIDFKLYEITENNNHELLQQYAYYYHQDNIRGVPVAFIGQEVLVGFGSSETTGQTIINLINKQLGLNQQFNENQKTENTKIVNFLWWKKLDLSQLSLPVLTIVVGLLDGFNPCAMWVLLFLISLLLGMENRRRMWLLGSLFIIASGLVYYFFMAAWLNFLMFFGLIFWVRLLIGIVAVTVGGKNLYDWWQTRKAEGVVCRVTSQESSKKIFSKLKDVVYKTSLFWSVIGIILLGFSVNLVELLCSAGFPAVYTQILSMSDIPNWKKYLYMFGYIVFYMLDDIIVFVLAMITLKSKTIGSKYAKYANLVGGLLIFILGILLIFKPQWLIFG